MISTDDKEIYKFCKSLRSHGWARDLENNNDRNDYESKFKNAFKFILPSYNVRPNEFNDFRPVSIKKIRKIFKWKKKKCCFF